MPVAAKISACIIWQVALLLRKWPFKVNLSASLQFVPDVFRFDVLASHFVRFFVPLRHK
jgi:hypothetical protein